MTNADTLSTDFAKELMDRFDNWERCVLCGTFLSHFNKEEYRCQRCHDGEYKYVELKPRSRETSRWYECSCGPDSPGPCTYSPRNFKAEVEGKKYILSLPFCQGVGSYVQPRDMAWAASEYFGRKLINIRRDEPSLEDYCRTLGKPLPFVVDGGTHNSKYCLVRDVIRALPYHQRPNCDGCGQRISLRVALRRLFLLNENGPTSVPGPILCRANRHEKRNRWDWTDERADKCLNMYYQAVERKHDERKKEKQCLKEGRRLLKQLRKNLRNQLA